MREIALASGVKNKEVIDYLFANLKTKLDFCKIIITNYCDNNFVYLLIACDDEYVAPCERIIKEAIVDYIELVYKIDYLSKKIKCNISDELLFNAYLKVLSLFDKVTDQEALYKIIAFNQTFFVDSFLEFRLLPLKKHWDNLAGLSSENIALFNSNTFIDVIKYLIGTIEKPVYKIKIVHNADKNNFSIYNMKSKHDKINKLCECDSAIDLITNVLNNCPTYIDIYLKQDKDFESIKFLSNVFSNRLKIYMQNN